MVSTAVLGPLAYVGTTVILLAVGFYDSFRRGGADSLYTMDAMSFATVCIAGSSAMAWRSQTSLISLLADR